MEESSIAAVIQSDATIDEEMDTNPVNIDMTMQSQGSPLTLKDGSPPGSEHKLCRSPA